VIERKETKSEEYFNCYVLLFPVKINHHLSAISFASL